VTNTLIVYFHAEIRHFVQSYTGCLDDLQD